MQATLNVRIDPVLKERGDRVLRENGVSVTEAVRALWSELVESRQVPAFMKPDGNDDVEKERKLTALERLSSLADAENGCASGASASRLCIDDISRLTDEQLRNLVYETAYARYEALS